MTAPLASRPRAALVLFVVLVLPLSWYSWLLGFADDPGNSGINPLGPLVAALLVSSLAGWAAFKSFLQRIVRVRTAWTTYAAALLLPILLCLAAVETAVLLGAPAPWSAAQAHWKEAVDAFIIAFLFVALGEEPGWRGWLQPRLQQLGSPIAAALALAPIWALWHLPLMGRQLPTDQIAPFLLNVAAASIVLAWLTNRTRGGVLPAMLCHATVNAVGANFLFRFFEGPVQTRLWWFYTAIWLGTAIAIALATKGRLGLRTDDDFRSA
jgi:membrane protease YdiL (CAAX protease family)